VERASDTPTQIMFPDDMLAVQTEGGTWAERFNRASPINDGGVMSAVLWWLGVTALALVIAPYLFLAFPALADRGYGLARISAMLVIGWLGWLGANLRAPLWSAGGLWLITGVLAVGAVLIILRQRRQITAFVRTRWRLLLTIEILGAVLYVGFLLVRLSNPDLWTVGFGGEKPMDFAYFNAVLRSTIFPAIDPWHAGGYLNYYYFGYVVVGAPVLMFQVVPSIAYNLLIPTIAATLGLGGFSVAFALVSRWTRRGADGIQRPRANPYLAGIAALIMVTVLGNLDTPRVLLRGMADLGGYDASTTDMSWYLVENHRWQTGSPPDAETMAELSKRVDNPTLIDRVGYQLFHTPRFLGSIFTGAQRMFMDGQQPRIANDRWFWAPSRTITESVGGYAINEMPMFTFVYGDLHAHMISLPLMTLAIAFVFNELALAGREQRRLTGRFLALLLGAVTCGLFIAVNTWEYPTFMLFGVLGLGYAWWLTWRGFSRRALWHMLLTVGGFLVLAWLAALPYNHWFASAYNAVRPWEGSKTPLWAYFNIHGLFLFLITSLLVWESARWLKSARVRALTGRRNLIAAAGGLLLAALVATVWLANRGPVVALVVVPLILWIGLLFFRPNQSIPMQFTLVIAGLALAITLGVEVVVLEGDIGRQNTVFKFYMQVWVLLSIAGGAAFAWLYDSINRWPGLVRNVWIFAGAAMLFAAVLFPLLSVPAKAVYRLSDGTPATLDGAAFMDYTTSYFEDTGIVDMQADARIIRWLQDNVEGTPAIMEAQSGDSYRWGNRISIQTGLPTVIGWNFHQRQQRGLDPLQEIVWQRMANVNNFYRTTDIADAWNILHHYNIKYLIVGGLERAVYGESGGLDKFAEMESLGLLRTVYQEGTAHIAAHIYEVNRAAGPLALAMRPADQPADQP
jgi:YYY domain-containing protein